MSAHCHECGSDLAYDLSCELCDARAERDRYREALELLEACATSPDAMAEYRGAVGPINWTRQEWVADIARSALSQEARSDAT